MVTVENGSEWRSQVLVGFADRLTSPQGSRLSEHALATLAQAGFTPPHWRDLANRVLMGHLMGPIQFKYSGSSLARVRR